MRINDQDEEPPEDNADDANEDEEISNDPLSQMTPRSRRRFLRRYMKSTQNEQQTCVDTAKLSYTPSEDRNTSSEYDLSPVQTHFTQTSTPSFSSSPPWNQCVEGSGGMVRIEEGAK